MRELIETVRWNRPDLPALETCHLMITESGYELKGSILAKLDGRPLGIRYTVVTDEHWVTQRVNIQRIRRATGEEIDDRPSTEDKPPSPASLDLVLTKDREGHWLSDQAGIPAEILGVDFGKNIIDVDLGISPSTNTLPIRRLKLEPGQSADVAALLISFPNLSLSRLDQRYTCIEKNRYLYETLDAEFKAEIILDEHGLIEKYGELWHRQTA